MTFRDLLKIAEEKGWMDKKVKVQYRDDGGDYYGTDSEIRLWEEDGVIIL